MRKVSDAGSAPHSGTVCAARRCVCSGCFFSLKDRAAILLGQLSTFTDRRAAAGAGQG